MYEQLLTARKVFQDGTWQAVDATGVEIPDPDSILQRGILGALLRCANRSVSPVDDGYLVVGHRPARPLDPPKRTKTKQQRQNEQILMLLLQ